MAPGKRYDEIIRLIDEVLRDQSGYQADRVVAFVEQPGRRLRAELIRPLRRLARARGLEPEVASYAGIGIAIRPAPRRPYVASHLWVPHRLPGWTSGLGARVPRVPQLGSQSRADVRRSCILEHPIRFAHGTGGHAPALEVARRAKAFGVDGAVYTLGNPRRRRS